ncbi:unnamed protein product, partial [marine sediment metagenome]
MTKLGESQYMLTKDSDGVIGANLGTLTAVGTLSFIYLGDWYENCFSVGNCRLQEDMIIRFLDITIKKLHPAPI